MPHRFHLPIGMHGCVCTRLARWIVSHEIRFIMAQTPQARLEVRAAGRVLLRYAQESSWREDNRRVSNGDQVSRVAALAMKRGKSVDFTGYWQRHIAG